MAWELEVRRWQEMLSTKAWWCRWGLVIIFNMVIFAHPSWEFKRGLKLPCQFLVVIHPWNLSQFLPPVRHIMHLGSPNHPVLQLLHWGSGEDISYPPPLSFQLALGGVVHLWSQLWGNFQVKVHRSLFIFLGFPTPLGSMVFWSRGHGCPLATPGSASSSIP